MRARAKKASCRRDRWPAGGVRQLDKYSGFHSKATYFVEIFLTLVPRPLVAAERSPFVKGGRAAGDPCVVVETAAPAEHLTARVGLFDTRILGAVDHGRLVPPVVLAVTELEGAGWGRDALDVAWVDDARLDDEDFDLRVLGQTPSDGAAGGTAYVVIVRWGQGRERRGTSSYLPQR